MRDHQGQGKVTPEEATSEDVAPEEALHQEGMKEGKEVTPPDGIESKKRKKNQKPSAVVPNKNYTICVKYDSILQLEFIKEDELVIVEQPWLTIVNSLPDPLERRIYGT